MVGSRKKTVVKIKPTQNEVMTAAAAPASCVPGRIRGQRLGALVQICETLMAMSQFARKLMCWLLVVAAPALVQGQGSFAPDGGEFGIVGTLSGDQVYPHLSVKTTGGYLVWQDNITDGSGLGISARKLDSSLSATLSTFRVNQIGTNDQELPQVSVLNDGGAVFVWQGGVQGFQRIYARCLTAGGTWATTNDVLVSTFTNSQKDAVVTTLTDGNVVVAWANATNSMRNVYAQRLSPTGQRLSSELLVNQYTDFNQRSPAIAALSDGRFVVVWISEQQRFENSVDVYARLYAPNGAPASSEFVVNSATNACANPTVAPSADGGFLVTWMEATPYAATNKTYMQWDILARPVSAAGAGGLGVTRLVNTHTYGDQIAPKVSANGTDYLVVWTSLGQDGSQEGVYGQFLSGSGALSGGEFRVNTTTPGFQKFPAVAADGGARFLTVWSSFVGGAGSVDLYAQRYVSTAQPLYAPAAPYVSVLSSNALSVTWPVVQGYSVAHYEVYADGAATATVTVSNNWWTMTGLAPSSTHTFRLAYVLTDARRSPLSGVSSNTTYLAFSYFGIPIEWMSYYFGGNWPLPGDDSDGDGVSNKDEWLAGTNPTDASSVLRVRLRPTAQGLYLDWNTQPGLMYQVQASASPGGAWVNVGGARFAAGTTDSMYVGGGSAGFYRVVRLR
jgi:hypothetical protein